MRISDDKMLGCSSISSPAVNPGCNMNDWLGRSVTASDVGIESGWKREDVKVVNMDATRKTSVAAHAPKLASWISL